MFSLSKILWLQDYLMKSVIYGSQAEKGEMPTLDRLSACSRTAKRRQLSGSGISLGCLLDVSYVGFSGHVRPGGPRACWRD